MKKKDTLVDEILTKMYYKPSVWYYRYLGLSEEQYDRIVNVKSWLRRQNLAKLNEIYRRLENNE